MFNNENTMFKGFVTAEVYDASGNIKDIIETHNLVTNAGFASIAGLVGAISGYTAFGYQGVGTVNGTPAATDTQLNGGGEVARVATTNSLMTTSVTDDTLQLVGTFNFSTAYTIYEAGVFNAATVGTGTMLAEVSLGTITVQSGDSIQLTWKIQAS